MKEKLSNLIRTSLAAEFGMEGGKENWEAAERLIDAESTFSGGNAWWVLYYGLALAKSEVSKRCIIKVMEKFEPAERYGLAHLYGETNPQYNISKSEYSFLHLVINNPHFTTDEAKKLIGLLIDKGDFPTKQDGYNFHSKTAIERAFFEEKVELFNHMAEKWYTKKVPGLQVREVRAYALVKMYDSLRRPIFSESEKSKLEREIGQCGLMALKAYFTVNPGKEDTSQYKRKIEDFKRLVEQCRTGTLPTQREFEKESRALRGWVSKEYATIRDLVYREVLSNPEKAQAAYREYSNSKSDEAVTASSSSTQPVTTLVVVAGPVARSVRQGPVAALVSQFEEMTGKHNKVTPLGMK